MKIIVFGLSISSAWGNGHATLLRGLFRALHDEGHEVHFFELDTPYYAAHRDALKFDYVQLHLYRAWNEALPTIRQVLSGAQVAMVTSYCPDGIAACELILTAKTELRTVFYDMDTPVTLSRLANGETVPYLPAEGLAEFDLVLSYTGGEAIRALRNQLGAKYAASLYGWVDPAVHFRVPASPEFGTDLSYLGTYAADRQKALDDFLITPATNLKERHFVIAGAMYGDAGKWPANIRHFEHIAPPQHSAFYSSSNLTLSVTRGAMAAMGYCPSGRLFEAAACGTAVLSDWWEGLDTFFQPNEEILIAKSTEDAIAALNAGVAVLAGIGSRARERALDCHTAAVRARRLIELIESPSIALRESSPADATESMPVFAFREA